MPRTISVGLETHFGLSKTSYCFCLLVDPVLGSLEGYTSLDSNLSISGTTYYSTSNALPSSMPTSLALSVDSIDVQMLYYTAQFERAKLMRRYYDGATFQFFAVNYLGTLTDTVVLMGGRFGKADVDDNGALIELLPWSSLANKPMGYETSMTCQAPVFAEGFCENAVSIGGAGDGPSSSDPANYRNGTVSAVTSASTFTLSGIASAPDGWANKGRIQGLTGNNTGVLEAVKSWTAAGVVTLTLPLPFLPIIGETFRLHKGCMRDRPACIANNNIANFHFGFPHIPLEKLSQRTST